jgi:hypothetical protein
MVSVSSASEEEEETAEELLKKKKREEYYAGISSVPHSRWLELGGLLDAINAGRKDPPPDSEPPSNAMPDADIKEGDTT